MEILGTGNLRISAVTTKVVWSEDYRSSKLDTKVRLE